MPNYLFVQSQDPYTDRVTDDQFSLMTQLASEGKEVSIFLTQNGVIPAAFQAKCAAFDKLLDHTIKIYADRFSLEQRQIAETDLKRNIESAEIHVVVQAMLAGDKVIWN